MPKIESINVYDKAEKFAREGYPQLGIELLEEYLIARRQTLLEIYAAWDRYFESGSLVKT